MIIDKFFYCADQIFFLKDKRIYEISYDPLADKVIFVKEILNLEKITIDYNTISVYSKFKENKIVCIYDKQNVYININLFNRLKPENRSSFVKIRKDWFRRLFILGHIEDVLLFNKNLIIYYKDEIVNNIKTFMNLKLEKKQIFTSPTEILLTDVDKVISSSVHSVFTLVQQGTRFVLVYSNHFKRNYDITEYLLYPIQEYTFVMSINQVAVIHSTGMFVLFMSNEGFLIKTKNLAETPEIWNILKSTPFEVHLFIDQTIIHILQSGQRFLLLWLEETKIKPLIIPFLPKKFFDKKYEITTSS